MSLVDLLDKPIEDQVSSLTTKISGAGKLLACWGSAGSGKSMLALNIGFELAELGHKVLLIDFDSRRPSLAPALGITDPGAGLTAILRLARLQRLDRAELKRLSHNLKFGKRDLWFASGLNTPHRWSEMAPYETSELLELARREFDFTVVDVNEELDPGVLGADAGIARNTATRKVLELSDVVLGTFVSDPVGINRFLWDIKGLGGDYWPIANRVRASVLGRNPERQVRDAFYRATGLSIKSCLVEDQAALDAAMAQAAPLSISAKGSKLREAIRLLALDLADA